MAQSKKMNETNFSKLVKEFHAIGELIRARQDEKQSIMNSFDLEKKRYSAGKLSKKALESSAKKTNKEFLRLDKQIRGIIARANALGDFSKKLASQQAPKVFRAKASGIFLLKKKVKRKAAPRKKVSKKRAPRKKASKVKARRKVSKKKK